MKKVIDSVIDKVPQSPLLGGHGAYVMETSSGNFLRVVIVPTAYNPSISEDVVTKGNIQDWNMMVEATNGKSSDQKTAAAIKISEKW